MARCEYHTVLTTLPPSRPQHVLGDKESFANFTPSFQRKSEAATLAMKMAMDHFMFEGTQSLVKEMFIQELEEEVGV